MKFEIVNPVNEVEPVEVEKVVRLRLQSNDGYVELVALDKDGNTFTGGYLLTITPNGIFEICRNVSPDLGFPLTDNNEITIEKE